MTTRYLYASGLRNLAALLHGDEHLHTETPPSGLDASHRLPLLVYPILLGRALRGRGVEPRFRYTVTLNDWMPGEMDHPEGYKLNLSLRGRSLQYQEDPEACHATLADHWAAAVQEELAPVRTAMPEVEVRAVRASDLRHDKGFTTVLRFGLRRPRIMRELAEGALNAAVLEEPLQFAGVVCRRCRSIQGLTTYVEDWDRVAYRCAACGNEQESDILEQDYWGHGRLIGAAVTAALRPDIQIISGALLQPGSLDFQKGLYEKAVGSPPEQHELIAPRLLDFSGAVAVETEVLLERLLAVAEAWDHEELRLP